MSTFGFGFGERTPTRATMERPASQTENVRPGPVPGSMKPPSRLPAMTHTNGRTLLETSASDVNARSAGGYGGLMGPPSIKHKLQGLPEPIPKRKISDRKTLAERAGEPLNALRSHNTTTHKPSYARTDSNSAQVGSRVPSTAFQGYRNPSNTSTASSISNGSSNIRTPNRRTASRHTRMPSAPEPRTVKEDEYDSDGKDDSSIMTKRKAWDTKGRLEDMESMYSQLLKQVVSAAESKNAVEESLDVYKARVQELAQLNRDLTTTNRTLTADVDRFRNDLHTTTSDLRLARREFERDLQDAKRVFDEDLAEASSKLNKEVQVLRTEREHDAARFTKEMKEAKWEWQKQKDAETADMTTAHWEELEEEREKYAREKTMLQTQVDELRRAQENRAMESATEVQDLRNTVAKQQNQMEATSATVTGLRARISAEESRNAALETEKAGFINKMHFLEGNQEAQSLEFTTMSQKLADAVMLKEDTLVTLRKEEVQRRKLNAMILELRGNIRVYVRTRPLLAGEAEAEVPARVEYPDIDSLDGGKEMVVHAPTTFTATGKERNEKHAYAFDRVYGPSTANGQVFDDCRDLIQSVVDGYNVSILSYGQTGSGKTYGMSGPDGIIPSAIGMLLTEMARLRVKGWEYVVEARFVEVYNEMVNDLLGDAKAWEKDDGGSDDLNASVRGKKKERHEIHHDPTTGRTTVSNLCSVGLWPPPAGAEADEKDISAPADAPTTSSYTTRTVTALLATAAKNRRVAATKSNERSSRSHSIFMLSLRGSCAATGESSEGVLNLVDLAGSERLKQSGAEGARAKETASINRSLSALGDVIAATGGGEGGGHVPFRNSKLTYLLQSSLGGTGNGKSSRTLMLLHLSPLQTHWQESRGSLIFGSKVHGTHIGAAKKR